ncbi:MAG: NADH-quinone oxidoreductase subunit C [Legionellales bacterium]|nr:NADH-quinone oxidoreductase subunit C [Legionellales bacterium]
MKNAEIISLIKKYLSDEVERLIDDYNEVTIIVNSSDLLRVADVLKKSPFDFNMLMDLCGVDYLHYGLSDWETTDATARGFARGIERGSKKNMDKFYRDKRYGCVYHLQSLKHNTRIRMKVYLPEGSPVVDSVVEIWRAADWYEREAYDLYGIVFDNHPNLSRILTDYGFKEHPFRKDFPLSGYLEMRYDGKTQKVIYEPVDIDEREMLPKIFRNDVRYRKVPID